MSLSFLSYIIGLTIPGPDTHTQVATSTFQKELMSRSPLKTGTFMLRSRVLARLLSSSAAPLGLPGAPLGSQRMQLCTTWVQSEVINGYGQIYYSCVSKDAPQAPGGAVYCCGLRR